MKPREQIVLYWLDKCTESELTAGRLSFAINRLYYSLFYAISALYAAKGKSYTKHSAIRAAFHRDFVKPGIVKKRIGRLYDELFNARQQGDYIPMIEFDIVIIIEQVAEVKNVLPKIKKLINEL